MPKKNACLTIKELKDICEIVQKGKLVCLTGAGISLASGIPVFRGNTGFWAEYNPEIYGNMPGLISVLRADSVKLVKFITDFYNPILDSKPNPAHLALSYLEKSGLLKGVITQNIDNLHRQAGTRSVIELHGNAFRIFCWKCESSLTLEKDRIKEMLVLLARTKKSRAGLLRVLSRYCPRCPKCGGRFRVDIVLFGERLAEKDLARAQELLNDCRALLIVGSSLQVYPAAALPLYAKEKGAKIIEINSESSVLSDICDYRIMGNAAEILPEITSFLEKG